MQPVNTLQTYLAYAIRVSINWFCTHKLSCIVLLKCSAKGYITHDWYNYTRRNRGCETKSWKRRTTSSCLAIMRRKNVMRTWGICFSVGQFIVMVIGFPYNNALEWTWVCILSPVLPYMELWLFVLTKMEMAWVTSSLTYQYRSSISLFYLYLLFYHF